MRTMVPLVWKSCTESLLVDRTPFRDRLSRTRATRAAASGLWTGFYARQDRFYIPSHLPLWRPQPCRWSCPAGRVYLPRCLPVGPARSGARPVGRSRTDVSSSTSPGLSGYSDGLGPDTLRALFRDARTFRTANEIPGAHEDCLDLCFRSTTSTARSRWWMKLLFFKL